jgi:hypothetical protein
MKHSAPGLELRFEAEIKDASLRKVCVTLGHRVNINHPTDIVKYWYSRIGLASKEKLSSGFLRA